MRPVFLKGLHAQGSGCMQALQGPSTHRLCISRHVCGRVNSSCTCLHSSLCVPCLDSALPAASPASSSSSQPALPCPCHPAVCGCTHVAQALVWFFRVHQAQKFPVAIVERLCWAAAASSDHGCLAMTAASPAHPRSQSGHPDPEHGREGGPVLHAPQPLPEHRLAPAAGFTCQGRVAAQPGFKVRAACPSTAWDPGPYTGVPASRLGWCRLRR